MRYKCGGNEDFNLVGYETMFVFGVTALSGPGPPHSRGF